jgi:hypothetical protein
MSDFDPGGFIISDTGDYRDDVKEQLNVVLNNPVGRVLLEFIEVNPKYIRIVPYTQGYSDTQVVPDNPRNAAPEGVVPYMGHGDGQFTYRDAKGKLVPSMRDDKYDWRATGGGTDVHLYYSPTPKRPHGNYGSQADEVLCHELVHAYRDMQGLDNPAPTTTKDLYRYLNEEEWLAILITNIYLSAKNRPSNQFRADHQDYEELKAPLNSSVGFLNHPDHRGLVKKFWAQEIPLYVELANVFAPYNPIHEFVNNQEKYFRA